MAESFADMPLAEPLLAAVEELGFVDPKEKQSILIAAMLSGSDVLAIMPPGTGGTTAYLMGLIQLLLSDVSGEGRGPRALVLAPTRDQAMQIGRMIKQLGHDTRLRFGTVVGGRPYPTQHQLLRRPLDILVATPGRLMDHIRRGRVPFERLKLLLLDKADRMLDMGLGSEIYGIVDASGLAREQTIILSEAPNAAVNLLAARLMNEPVSVGVEASEAVAKPAAEKPSERHDAAESELFEEEDRQPPGLRSTGETTNTPGKRSKPPRGKRRTGGSGAKEAQNGKHGKASRGTRAPHQGGAQKSGTQTALNKQTKAGLRGPGRRSTTGQGGRGRRMSDVRFPSDYASGPGGPPKAPPAEPRGPRANEPVQYSADYGFSVAPGARKPVNVVYRTKNRRRREDGSESDKSDNGEE